MDKKDILALGSEIRLALDVCAETLGRARQWIRRNRADIAIGAAVFLVAGAGCLLLALRIPPELTDPELGAGGWFESDFIRVYRSMVNRGADNYRTNLHPLYALVMYAPTKIMLIVGIPERMAVIIYLSGVAGLWAAAFFAILRGIGHQLADALLLTVFAATASTAIFWFPVPEIYGVGSLSIVFALAMGLLIQRGALGGLTQAAVSAATLSITTTNWAMGILLVFSGNSLRKSVRITFDAVLVITILFAVQKVLLPRSEFFVPRIGHELSFIFHELSGGFSDKLRAFFLYGVAIPEVPFLDNNLEFPGWKRLSVQLEPLSTLRPGGIAGLVLWVPFFLFGLFCAMRSQEYRKLVIVLCLYLCFQLVLHSFYGDETFLYSLNYVPGMIVLASFGLFSRHRNVVKTGLIFMTLACAYNNITEYLRVTHDLAAYVAQVTG